jgi:hypothetical protein
MRGLEGRPGVESHGLGLGFYDKLGFVVTKEIEGAGPQMSRSL